MNRARRSVFRMTVKEAPESSDTGARFSDIEGRFQKFLQKKQILMLQSRLAELEAEYRQLNSEDDQPFNRRARALVFLHQAQEQGDISTARKILEIIASRDQEDTGYNDNEFASSSSGNK